MIDDGVRAALEELAELAPLHNRPALAAIARRDAGAPATYRTSRSSTPRSTARSRTRRRRTRCRPGGASEWGIRRYGFHGLSVQWAAEQVRVPRLVVCHLGGGCSVTAVRDGRSVDTTMGFSPLEGVPMATRSGSIDAEIVLHLLRTRKLTLEEIEQALESESGLLGLSGETARVEELERSGSASASSRSTSSRYRVAAAVASMAAALGGIDALVFTAGIGEGSASVRRDVCERLALPRRRARRRGERGAVPDVDVNAPGARARRGAACPRGCRRGAGRAAAAQVAPSSRFACSSICSSRV